MNSLLDGERIIRVSIHVPLDVTAEQVLGRGTQ